MFVTFGENKPPLSVRTGSGGYLYEALSKSL